MAIKIGHACFDERGKVTGGAAGDSNKREVCTRAWYNGGWNVVLRPKNADLAEKTAKACEAACANDKIGYDQFQRNTLYTQAKNVGYDLAKISTACECDCSSLMHICAIAGGAKLTYGSNGLVTWNMADAFVKSGDYEKLTASKYLTSDAYLKRGDILIKESSHTAMVLENGSKSGAVNTTTKPAASSTTTKKVKVDPAKHYDRMYGTGKGKVYTVTASALNMRAGASTSKQIIKVLPKGSKVTCYGYYTLYGSTIWLFVVAEDGTSGYCSKAYLK